MNIDGTNGADVLIGTGDADIILGFDGADLIFANGGDDRAEGGGGNDRILGGEGRDQLYGDDGDDEIGGDAGDDFIAGAIGRDYLYGGLGADQILGGADDDQLFGEDGADLIGGDAGNDYIEGGVGADYLYGGDGNDLLLGGADNDQLFGQDGDDQIGGDAGNDYIEGGAGADYLYGAAGNDTIIGGANNDQLFGQDGDDVIGGDDGDDYVEGGAGRDYVYLGAGLDFAVGGADDDTLLGQGGDDRLFGNDGADLIGGDDGNDYLEGGAGADYVFGGVGADVVLGGAGNDQLFGQDGNDLIGDGEGDNYMEGGAGLDYMYGGTGADTILGGADDDQLFGQSGNDLIGGGTGNDYIEGGAGADYLYGEGGIDVIIGGAENDQLYGQDGDDQIGGGDGNDYIEGGAGADYLYGEGGVDFIIGGADNDQLFGQEGDDLIDGGDGNDFIVGGAGNDTLFGNAGADTMFGDLGADNFAFLGPIGPTHIDSIGDFTVGSDHIMLGGEAGQAFFALASGMLRTECFFIGAAAVAPDDYLIYDNATGALFYDADGNGAGAAIQLAFLSTGLALTAADFVVSGPFNAAPAIASGATASVAENSPATTIVYQAQASDGDGDRITYSLTGADAVLLTIDNNGVVRLLDPANFEVKASYAFNVVASDSGSSAAKAVTLTITDVVEGTPIISETSAPNDSIGTAQVIDRGTLVIAVNANLPNDRLPSATIQGVVSGNFDKDFFSVTLQAGEKLILDVDGTAGGLDSHVFVYGPTGVLVGDNDDRGSFDPGSVPTIADHNTDSYFQFRAQTAGTYYFSIEGFQGGSSGSYKLNVGVGPPASADEIQAELFDDDIDALISGSQWNHNNLTYGFPQLAAQYPGSFPEANPDDEFRPFSLVQQAATRQLLQVVANVASLTFTELTGGSDPFSGAGSANLRYAMTTDSEIGAAHAYYPTNGGPTSPGGSAWFNTTSFSNPLRGNYAWVGILHETGHALGLEHGHEDPPVVSPDHDSLEYTVMTYRSYVGDPLSGGYSNEQFGYPQTLMMLDIGALQRVYGANFAFNAGDSVYYWDPSTGEMWINSQGQGAPGSGNGGSSNRVFMTIWDGGGNDTYDLSNYSTSLTIDLRPGQWTNLGGQLANLGDGNFARGNIANALQYQSDSRSLIENAIGGSNSDTLIANAAANHLTGNGGGDTFKWTSAANAGAGAGADHVLDFARGSDRIDLSTIDTISGGSDDAFAFIGTNAFSNVAGQLRYQVEGTDLRVQGDIDGNGLADFEIVVHNNTIFAASDFFL